MSALLLASALPAAAQQTAKTAMATFAKLRPGVANQVTQVAGVRGQDQPMAWQIVTRDPEYRGALREHVVQCSGIVLERVLPPSDRNAAPHATFAQRAVKVDSKMAFAAADKAAKKALVGFDSINYQLRAKELSNEPVWSVNLIDQFGQTVGNLIVSASTGTVLSRTWYDVPAQPANGQAYANNGQPQPGRGAVYANNQPQSDSTMQRVWEKTRYGFEQGREVVKENVVRAGATVRDWWNSAVHGESQQGSWQNGQYDSRGR